jgi:hypothetical protein
MRTESNKDEFVNAELLELQIKVSVGKTTGTPMLRVTYENSAC